MGRRAASDWFRALGGRLREHWWLKSVGIAVYMTAFMCAYFALLNHPQFPVTVMPLEPIDHWIDFVPAAIMPYASLWLYIALVPGLLHLRGEMARYVVAVTVVSGIGLGVFFLWPTAVPASGLDWSRWPMVAAIKSADAGGNACPSLHVAFSVFTAIWLGWLLRRVGAPRWARVVNLVWCLLIIWSTMATRQHVAADVEAGALLGAAVALASLWRWSPCEVGAPTQAARPAHGTAC